MGRIKTKEIKRTGKELMERFPDKFAPDFDHNKKVLSDIGLSVSKTVRNKIAGYITRQTKIQAREK